MSLTFKKPIKYQPGALTNGPNLVAKRNFDLVKHLVHFAVDKVAPGLGKKQKAEAVHNISLVVHKLGSYTAKGVVKAVKHVIGDPASFLSVNHLPAIPSVKIPNMTSYRSQSRASKSVFSPGGGVAIGGSTTKAPVSVSHKISRTSKPRMSSRGGTMTVGHSEMLGSILSGTPTANVTAYRAIGFRANPGMTTVFPWLSSMAVNFEKYRFTRLRFSLIPLVSTAFNGRIGIGFDYDSSDAPPGNRQEFYSLTTHCETMPWEASAINVQCDGSYRFTGTHASADNKLIDLGQVIVMSDAVSNAATISAALPLYDLIVDYEVELIEPQQALFSTQMYTNNTNLTIGIPLGTGADTTSTFGPTVITSITTTATVMSISIPAGTYHVSYFHQWSSGTTSIVPTVATAGVASKLSFTNGGSTAHALLFLSSPVEFVLTLTAGGVAWNANLVKFNLIATRIASQLFSGYTS